MGSGWIPKESLHIGFKGPFTNLPFGICAMHFDYGAHGTVVFLCKFASNMLISLLSSGKRCNGKDVAFISMMYFLFKHFWDTFWSMFVFHYILLIWTYTVHLMMVNVGFNIPVPWSIHVHPRYTNTLDSWWKRKMLELRWALLGSWAIDKLCPSGLINGGPGPRMSILPQDSMAYLRAPERGRNTFEL